MTSPTFARLLSPSITYRTCIDSPLLDRLDRVGILQGFGFSLMRHPFLRPGERAGQPVPVLTARARCEAGKEMGLRRFVAFGTGAEITSWR
jgi:hypothetical protein